MPKNSLVSSFLNDDVPR
nr:hypothetical protein [Rickettsia endosymbiont of Ceutorhynchus assimilis]